MSARDELAALQREIEMRGKTESGYIAYYRMQNCMRGMRYYHDDQAKLVKLTMRVLKGE